MSGPDELAFVAPDDAPLAVVVVVVVVLVVVAARDRTDGLGAGSARNASSPTALRARKASPP